MAAEPHRFFCLPRSAWARGLALTVLSAVPALALAQDVGGPSLPLVIGQGAGGNSYSVPIQTLLFFTALSFLPAVVLMMTGFTRIVIVLSLLRQALGGDGARGDEQGPDRHRAARGGAGRL